ncbi:microviridin/marinostatin family tricyclic proteinase inhibitor [Olivibacter sp. SDN3]|uniref:microviridin/marinostatin family tricyclic proteinase inhibitor n=1 Tax=Olivibacter sp. SDN3 TaxID=2764720 RepID=UPI0016514248|nr:microviridin/marinostatin family tricyclic proteinase inhibitor [Olivibacter sp. SDN3]QNL48839.1 microviridin/marinostatin family tricyclic proteinase inhibitor [Olivibacter sp. SDN3]
METTKRKQPFFAKFLEGQKTEKDAKNQKGTQQGSSNFFEEGWDVTLKFPSDSDEGL